MGDIGMSSKPKVLILGSPLDYIDNDYLNEFQKDYDVDVSFEMSVRKFSPKQTRFFSNGLTEKNWSRSCMPATAQKPRTASRQKSRKMDLTKQQ